MAFVKETVQLSLVGLGRPVEQGQFRQSGVGQGQFRQPFNETELLAIEREIQEHADAINLNFGSTIDVDTAPSATDHPELRGKWVTVKSSGTDQLWFYGNIAGIAARTQIFP